MARRRVQDAHPAGRAVDGDPRLAPRGDPHAPAARREADVVDAERRPHAPAQPRALRLADAALRRRTHVAVGSYNIQRTGARVVTPSLGSGRLTVLDGHGRVAGQAHVAESAHDACIVG